MGETITGRLTPDDPTFADGSHYRAYPFTGAGGDTVTADVESVDFDANVILTDGHGNRLTSNDDAGGNCNARLTSVLPQGGPYRIYVNSSATAEVGAFQLALRRGAGVAPDDTTCRGFGSVAGLILVGQTIEGTLTSKDHMFPGDSSYFQRWVMPVTRGQPFTIDLTSDAFDAYLVLTHGPGDKVLENDDGGNACNARLVYTPPDDRPLRIIVNTARKHETGPYVLRVSAGLTITDVKGQCARGN
jgi:serine protease Do